MAREEIPLVLLTITEILRDIDCPRAGIAAVEVLRQCAGLEIAFPKEQDLEKYIREQRVVTAIYRDPSSVNTGRLARLFDVDRREIPKLLKRAKGVGLVELRKSRGLNPITGRHKPSRNELAV